MFCFHQDYLKIWACVGAVGGGLASGVCKVPGDALIVLDTVWNINPSWSD